MTREKPAYKRIRKTWAINPKTRVKKSGKIYSRGKNKQEVREVVKKVRGK